MIPKVKKETTNAHVFNYGLLWYLLPRPWNWTKAPLGPITI